MSIDVLERQTAEPHERKEIAVDLLLQDTILLLGVFALGTH